MTLQSNVIRSDEIAYSSSVVHLPIEPDILPARAEDDRRARLEVQNRIVRETREMARKARLEGEADKTSAAAEAAGILAKAKEQATAIVAGAKREEERIHAEARAKGMAQAREEARVDAMEKVSAILMTLDLAARKVRGARESFLRASLDGMMQIVEAALEEIMRARIDVDRACVLRALESAVTELTAADRLTVRVHPDDVGAASDWQDELLARISGLTDIAIQSDLGISKGGVILETAFGRVDARLQAQLHEILREARVAVAGMNDVVSDDADENAAPPEEGASPGGGAAS